MLKPGRNSTSFSAAWNHGKTQTIRVPIALSEQIMEYARAIDAGMTTSQGEILKAIDGYIAWRQQNYRSTQNSKQPDTNARTWDELRKFRRMVEMSCDIAGKTSAGQ